MRPTSGRNATRKAAQAHIVTPSPLHHPYSRDSDVSNLSGQNPHCSALLTDAASKSAALRAINSYLASISATFSLKPPLPSAKDITSCFRLFLSRLHFEQVSNNLEEDVMILLKTLKCPIKFRRSAFKSPGTPHSWPELRSALYWLLQLVRFAEHPSNTTLPARAENYLHTYISKSYSLYMSGRDEEAAMMDEEYRNNVRKEAEKAGEVVLGMEKELAELEERVRITETAPSVKEEKERLRDNLKDDAKKFEVVAEKYNKHVLEMEREFKESEMKLEAKEKERVRIGLENEELKKKIEEQGVNARDVERMRREMEILDREIAELESGRDAMEEKGWELDEAIQKNCKELNVLVEQCNQAIRQLKLGDDLQLVLNTEGSTLPEILGIDYKNILKPSLDALAEDTKRASSSKSEELNALIRQSCENSSMLEEKKASLAALQATAEEGEARLRSIQKKIDDYASNCAAEAKMLVERYEKRERDLNLVEKEANEFLQDSEKVFEEATKKTYEEIQMCARELLASVDLISEYKEYIETLESSMRLELMDLVKFLRDASDAAVSTKINSILCL